MRARRTRPPHRARVHHARHTTPARGVLALLALSVLAGCAGLAPMGPGTPAPTTRTSTAPGATPGAAAGTPAPAGVDSAPSSDALAILATIPEPLSPAERTAPPAGGAHAPPAASRAARADSEAGAPADSIAAPAAPAGADRASAVQGDTAAVSPFDSAGTGVPVPEPTMPLGERPGAAGQTLPESTLVPSGKVPHAATASARPDTCWRLQIGAPPEQAKAEGLLSVASSQLVTPFVIELENKRYKVRSRDCMGRVAVEALRARARRSGFQGTFVIHTTIKVKQALQP